MRAKRDVVRVFHHKGEKITRNRVRIAHPDTTRAFSIPLRIGIERILQKSGHQFMHRPKPNDATRYAQLRFDLDNPLGDILGEIANALEIAWNPNSRDKFAKIRRQRLPPRDRRDRLFLDIALQYIKAPVAPDGRIGEIGVEIK
jgi:hypothetical protein